MRVLLILFFLAGCASWPMSDARNYGQNKHLMKIQNCTYDFMDNFGTDIEKTYNVCEKMHRNDK